MDSADLNTLCHLAGRKEYAWLTDYLSNPRSPADPAFFSGHQGSFQHAVDELRSNLAGVPDIRHLLDLFLLSRYLLDPDEASEWVTSWVDNNIEIDRHLPGIDKQQALGGRLCAVPVVSVCGAACVRYFITGLIRGRADGNLWPPWVDPLLDDEAKGAIHSAAAAARRYVPPQPGHSLYCYPLTVANGKCQFAGSSLGLALALGFLSVLSGRPISSRLLASGSIRSSGEVNRVGNLDLKLKCACHEKFNVFLGPDQNLSGFPPQDLENLPVSNLSEAWLISALYAPGRGQELLTLLRMLKDPKVFVNNMDHVNYEWFRWVGRLHQLEKVADAITNSTELLQGFVEKMGRVLKSWNLEATATLSDLISPELFQRMSATSPLSAFRFCTFNLALNNHRGDVAAADKWACAGRELFPSALQADINACADFLNNRFVSRHNCYTFEPEFPAEVADLMACLERRYAAQRDGGCLTDPVLGELYGTIAQNFAFCGATYLSDCDDFLERAVKAFGGGRVPEYKYQILREYCYQVYACLDAGLIDRAETKLRTYLEVEDWSQIWSELDRKRFSPFQHAVLARFLADSALSEKKNTYLRWALKHQNSLSDPKHPWQLWSYNMGRIAYDMEDYDSAFMMHAQSLAHCMSEENGSTLRVMALLPSAGLRQLNALDKVNFKDKEKDIMQAARELDSDHFKLLFENNVDHILDTVREQPQVLFPFTYR